MPTKRPTSSPVTRLKAMTSSPMGVVARLSAYFSPFSPPSLGSPMVWPSTTMVITPSPRKSSTPFLSLSSVPSQRPTSVGGARLTGFWGAVAQAPSSRRTRGSSRIGNEGM